MSEFDLIIRGAQVVTPDAVKPWEIGVTDGKIAALESQVRGSGKAEVNASGLHVFPGVIDAHVHFNDPGRADWEGIATGSRAHAAGGGTLFFDMPLNAHPPTVDAESFQLKLAVAERTSLTDFALWGGIVPGNVDKLAELADCGVIGFKAFMSNSGIDDFSCVDDATLRAGMKRAASLGLLVAVHAESETETSRLTRGQIAAGRTSARDYLDSRPVAAELDAIRCAIELSGETGCALHIVHVSCGAGVAVVADARRRGANVTCETCPHYLTLTEDDLLRIGALAKCAPPVRTPDEQASLWQHLLAGDITTVGSDHSPSPPDMKQSDNFFKIWGGISGVQHTIPLLLTGAAQRGASDALPLLAGLLSDRVARRFQLPKSKGRIAIGADADFAIVDLDAEFVVTREELHYRHKQSPYVDRKLRGKVESTFVRGEPVYRNVKPFTGAFGKLVKPSF